MIENIYCMHDKSVSQKLIVEILNSLEASQKKNK